MPDERRDGRSTTLDRVPHDAAQGSHRTTGRIGAPSWAVALVAAIVTLSCSGGSSRESEDERSAAVYAVIVDWFVSAASDDPEPLPVFVEPRGDGATIPLEVQTELISAVAERAEVRFIDVRDEALVEDDDGGLVVADGGVLLRLPPVDEMADPVIADVDLHLHDDEFLTLRFAVTPGTEGWTLEGAPEQIALPTEGDAQTDD